MGGAASVEVVELSGVEVAVAVGAGSPGVVTSDAGVTPCDALEVSLATEDADATGSASGTLTGEPSGFKAVG